MSSHNDAFTAEGRHDRGQDSARTVEAYQVDDGVVLHDAEDPFAWVEASVAVDLTETT
jgi:hypothetical protein